MENLTQHTTTGTPKAPVETKKIRLSSTLYIGYAFLAISFLLFVSWDLYFDVNNSNAVGFFAVHYAIMLVYVAILAPQDAFGLLRCWRKENVDTTVVALNLGLISAFALNRSLPVFQQSVDWLCGYLIISSLTLLSYRYFYSIPAPFRFILHFLLGAAAVLYLYLMIYTLPFYMVGGIGMLLLGVGGHIFVPLGLLTACWFLFAHHRRRMSTRWVIGGAAAVVLFAAGFVVEWHSRAARIERAVNQSVLNPDLELPLWVRLAETMKRDWITMRLLKSGWVYTTVKDEFSFMPGSAGWDEAPTHDPLVFISSLIRTTGLSREDRVKALQAISDSRHPGNERLWPGDNLTTSYVVSDVDIYPALRLAYTEKYLNVRNNAVDSWWGNTQEALYTFQLPEGSVITSLSLWIEGQEQKGILTSKNKATEAYREIVGVLQRDPSVVHWQEGNTVTVRVFPCTPSEERKFKVGITSPLVERDGQLYYRSMTFQGPSSAEARETYRVRFPRYSGPVDMPGYFTKLANGDFLSEGDYDADFELEVPLVSVPENHFTFDGYTYSLAEYKATYTPAQWKRVYLDVNAAWTEMELKQLKPVLEGLDVYAYLDGAALKLEGANWDEVTGKMRQHNFSLFPFHHVKNKDHTLVVTKGRELSPHLSDFSESAFAQGAMAAMGKGKKVKVFNLNGGVSTYISSLREFRGIAFARGDVRVLADLLTRRVFPADVESDDKVVLHDAGLVLTRARAADLAKVPANAPDHLARLFAYNDIMRKVGTRYFSNDFVNKDLIDEAAAAYVVSPVSSLIVLEKQADYDRFGIKDTANSLHNASKDAAGAVPEPHEWALIGLFLLFVLYTVRRRYFLKAAQ